MAVTNTQSLFQFAVAALGQAFNPNVSIQNATDFQVWGTSGTTGIDTVLTLNVDYFVTGAFVAGVCSAPTITLENAGLHYAIGDTLTVQRGPSITQPTNLVDGTKYLAATTNNALDWLCYTVQELRDMVTRSFRVPLTRPAISPLLPISGALLMNNAISKETGGGVTALDGFPVSLVAALQLPFALAIWINGEIAVWVLRGPQAGDPGASIAGAFVVPAVTNPNSLIWVRGL